MKAYLIDPWTRTVTEVQRGEDNNGNSRLHEIYALLGCDAIEAVNPHNAGSDIIYVDEEGLFKDGQMFFYCRLWPQESLAGKGLWVGTTRSGDDASPTVTRQYVEDHIIWMRRFDV
jgi:hypothetical protein